MTKLSTISTRLGELLRMSLVRRLLIVVALVLCYQVWISVQAHGKATDNVGQHSVNGRFSVDVHMGFKPERFHILKLQHHGRIAGADGDVVHLRGVSQAGVHAVARFYWVDKITPGSDDTEGTP